MYTYHFEIDNQCVHKNVFLFLCFVGFFWGGVFSLENFTHMEMVLAKTALLGHLISYIEHFLIFSWIYDK